MTGQTLALKQPEPVDVKAKGPQRPPLLPLRRRKGACARRAVSSNLRRSQRQPRRAAVF